MARIPWQHRFWRAFYDCAAFVYDAVMHAGARLHLGSEERIRREVITKLDLPTGARVLEIGCGTASNRAFLPAHIHYIGLDLSRGMLARALRAGGRCDLVQGDATALPFATGSSALSLAMGVFQHIFEPERAHREMLRVTRTAGSRLVIDEWRDRRRVLQAVASEDITFYRFGEYYVLRANP